MRILSGIQPSGKLHLGNYFGAMQQHIAAQDDASAERFYFIADYHSLTSLHDREQLWQLSHDVALDYLALGLDPARTVFYRQSDLPEVHELAWLLSCVTGMGLMERAHSYKDKTARGLVPRVGLFTYPLLMAADILIVRSDVVPVGADQVQHIEMAQDMAGSFNAAFDREVLVRPEPALGDTPRVPGTDGEKMSKSYGNTIEIFASGKPLKKAVMGIVTRPIDMGQPLPVEDDTVLALYRLFAGKDEVAEMEQAYREGAFGYGEAKKRLLAKIDERFAPARERRAELSQDPDMVEDILREGARKAREVARETMAACRDAVGLRARPA